MEICCPVILGLVLCVVSLYLLCHNEFHYVTQRDTTIFAQDNAVEALCYPDPRNNGKLVLVSGCNVQYPNLAARPEVPYYMEAKHQNVKSISWEAAIYQWMEFSSTKEYDGTTCPRGTFSAPRSVSVSLDIEPNNSFQDVEDLKVVSSGIKDLQAKPVWHSQARFLGNRDDPKQPRVRCTTYNYNKGWSHGPVTTFHDEDKWDRLPNGPTPNWDCDLTKSFQSGSVTSSRHEVLVAQDNKADGWELNEQLYQAITCWSALNLFETWSPEQFTYKNRGDHQDPQWSQLKSSAGMLEAKQKTGGPEIGDLKLEFSAVGGKPVTILAQQMASQSQEGNAKFYFQPLRHTSQFITHTSTGTINWLFDNQNLKLDEVIAKKQSENDSLLYGVRFMGCIMVFASLMLCTYPLQQISESIPCIGECLGNMVGCILMCVNCLLASGISLLAISISWVMARPSVGIPLLLVSLGLIAASMYTAFGSRKGKQEITFRNPEAEMAAFQSPAMPRPQVLADLPQPTPQPTAQPILAVQPKQTMQVTVPEGIEPGMPFQVSLPSGNQMTVTCPPGVFAGGVVAIAC